MTMKSTIQYAGTKLSFLFVLMLSSLYSLAQDGGAITSTNSVASHSESSVAPNDAAMWYSNPIVWVIGGVILLIIIILAAKSGKQTVSDTEVSRTTTTTTTIKRD